MALARDVSHPASRGFVLKLHRDADPARGVVCGRVESVASGRCFEFADVAGLIDGLARELVDGAGRDRDEPA